MERGTIGFEQERNAVISNEMRISFPCAATSAGGRALASISVRRTKRRAEWSSRSPPRNTEKWHNNNMDCCTAGYGQERYDDICHGVRPWRLSFHPLDCGSHPSGRLVLRWWTLRGGAHRLRRAVEPRDPQSVRRGLDSGTRLTLRCWVCVLLQWVVGAAGPLGRRSVL